MVELIKGTRRGALAFFAVGTLFTVAGALASYYSIIHQPQYTLGEVFGIGFILFGMLETISTEWWERRAGRVKQRLLSRS